MQKLLLSDIFLQYFRIIINAEVQFIKIMFEKKEKSSLINKITTSFRKVILLKVVCGVWYD